MTHLVSWRTASVKYPSHRDDYSCLASLVLSGGPCLTMQQKSLGKLQHSIAQSVISEQKKWRFLYDVGNMTEVRSNAQYVISEEEGTFLARISVWCWKHWFALAWSEKWLSLTTQICSEVILRLMWYDEWALPLVLAVIFRIIMGWLISDRPVGLSSGIKRSWKVWEKPQKATLICYCTECCAIDQSLRSLYISFVILLNLVVARVWFSVAGA